MSTFPKIELLVHRRTSRRAVPRTFALVALALVVLPITAGTSPDRSAGPRPRFGAPAGPRRGRNAIAPLEERPR